MHLELGSSFFQGHASQSQPRRLKSPQRRQNLAFIWSDIHWSNINYKLIAHDNGTVSRTSWLAWGQSRGQCDGCAWVGSVYTCLHGGVGEVCVCVHVFLWLCVHVLVSVWLVCVLCMWICAHIYIYGSFSWKLVKIVTKRVKIQCEFFNAITWKWKLDISCVHKNKT